MGAPDVLDQVDFRTPAMEALPLAQPVATILRRADPLQPEDSLAAAASSMQIERTDVLPIVNGPYLLGVASQASLAAALAAGEGPEGPVMAALRPAPTILAHASAAEALRSFEANSCGTLVVIDGEGRYIGVLSASDLFAQQRQPRPPLVGGMATPFGVYLTTGSLSAGAGGVALVATGAMLFAMFFIATLAAEGIAHLVPSSIGAHLLAPLQLAFFMIAMRLLPISGIHAAEHKVVHAIEREESLSPEVVSRMPRVHPRCGTNLAAGASIFLGLAGANWIPDQQLRLLLAALATLFLWKPVGSALQYYVTTRPPSKKHLAMGIRSGKELLEKYRTTGHAARPTVARRIWHSGMLHVMTGSLLCYLVAAALVKAFNLPIVL